MLLIFGVSLAICSILLWALSSPFYWKRKGVPYLFPYPLFGSYLPSSLMTIKDFYEKLYKNYQNEKYFGLHFFTRPALLIRDPLIIKDIFIRDFEYFSANAIYSNIDHDPFGENLLFLHGQAWKEVRLKLSQLFTPSKLRLMNDYVENIMKKATDFINKSMKENEEIEIVKMNVNIATDIIVQAVFGIESDCFEEKSLFNSLGAKMFGTKTNTKLLISLLAPKLNDLLKINIFGKDVTDFVENVMKDVIEYREKNQINKKDFLDAMINIMKTNENNNKNEKYFPDKTRVPEYSFKTVLAQALVLIAGGAESAAMAMSFFLYEASLNQEIQDKCREEIMAVVNETGTDIRYEDASKLTYLDMAIKGKHFARLEMLLVISRLLRNYRFTMSSKTEVPVKVCKYTTVITPNPGIWLNVEPIN